jgi:hypothetical protein
MPPDNYGSSRRQKGSTANAKIHHAEASARRYRLGSERTGPQRIAGVDKSARAKAAREGLGPASFIFTGHIRIVGWTNGSSPRFYRSNT